MKLAVLNGFMVALGLLASPIAGKAEQPALTPPTSSIDAAELLFLKVTINGVPQQGDYLLARRGDAFFVHPADLTSWGIKNLPTETTVIENDVFVPLAGIPGTTSQFDPGSQTIALTIPPALFNANRISALATRLKPTESAFAGFLNYDLSVEYRKKATIGAFLEAGVSNDWGLVTTTMTIGQRLKGIGFTRLDSYFLRDNPDTLTRLIVGDTITDARDWSRAIRFGGIRIGTAFSLQPSFITFPTPALNGQAAIPSSVELLVNNARSFQTDVAQGPFSINRVPFVNGAGEVTLIVRDALGIERRVTSSYYVSSSLLSPGLIAWSLEGGAERQYYGFRNFSYRNPFAAGTYRRGISDWLTLESRAEVSGKVQMAGAGANVVWSDIGEFGLAGAASNRAGGKGGLYRVFYRRIAPKWNIAVSYQRASRNYNELGINSDRDRITRQLQASAGISFRRRGTFGITYTDLEYADGDRMRVTSANYNIAVSRRAYLSVFAVRSSVSGGRTETTFGTGITIPFGPNTSGYVQADNRNFLAEIRRTPPTEGGWGYRLTGGAGESDRQQAELQWRGAAGEASIEAARVDGNTGVRGLFSGGLLVTGGRGYATRRLQDAVGVVNVPALPDVRIYQENRLVARTDSAGRAIIPNLRSYEANRIALAPSDIPIDAGMSDDTLVIVPRYRGAAGARFAIAKDKPATVVLQSPDGAAIDAGTSIRLGSGETSFAGYDGEVFVRNAVTGLTMDFDTQQGPCRVVIKTMPADDVLPRIGPLRCASVRRTL